MLERAALAVLALVLCAAVPARADDAPAADATRTEWSRTIERIASGVVSIQIDQTRAFDTEWNASAQATGFVIDAERGLILTNRHVVTPGPVTAQAVFQNREEVPLLPVYRDPVHDFGIYRYDPAALRFMKPAALPLYPAGAKVGTEIRVVGNDAGEQLSILAGTLARLDREAPVYGSGRYNDFNTFYFQAASSTSGGSSGSPVIDVQGRVVALNAGGATGAASSFYLPLDRVVRAVGFIRAGGPVPRGTLQAIFNYTPYDELKRLGLSSDTEARTRRAHPKSTGMLVVTEVQPGAPVDGVLAVGDILLSLDGRSVVDFISLEDVLDGRIGGEIEIVVERGGERLVKRATVQDLESITPAEFIELGDGVIHDLSWQMARGLNAPVRGVFVANPGYVFGAAAVPRGAVIVEMAGRRVTRLADVEAVLATLGDGARAPLRIITAEDARAPQLRVLRMDRRWFPARKCHRDDRAGVWPCAPLAPGPAADGNTPGATRFARTGDPVGDALSPSLALVSFVMPYSIAGVTERNYYGTGVVIDAVRGLIALDRNTVPVSLGDVRITFGGTVEVPGRVEYVHPLHNLAIVSYDPRLLGDTPIRAARFLARELTAGEDVYVVGLRGDNKLQVRATQVASVDPTYLPVSRTLQFRDANLETASLVNGPGDYDGVLADRQGRVLALWSSFAFDSGREVQQENRGVPAEHVLEMRDRLVAGKPFWSLEAEFQTRTLAGARQLGLSDEWVRRIEDHSPTRREVLSVTRLVAGAPAAALLQPGDMVLAVDGRVVNRFRELERAVGKPSVELTLWRDGAERKVVVDTVPLDGHDIDRVLLWAGATLHAPHRAMAAQRGIETTGVFVAYFLYGSPASRYQLVAGRRITEVDGVPVYDLDAFIRAVSGRPDRSSLRLKTIQWNGAVDMITLKLDKHYWPTYELRRTPAGWVRQELP
jgi:S1-C subfamily serine protease